MRSPHLLQTAIKCSVLRKWPIESVCVCVCVFYMAKLKTFEWVEDPY